MEKKIMVLIIVLGFTSLAFAQNTPQNIISSKNSDGLYALYLTERVISADVGSKISHWESIKNGIIQQGKAEESKVIRKQSDFSKLSNAREKTSKLGTCPEARNVRTMYN